MCCYVSGCCTVFRFLSASLPNPVNGSSSSAPGGASTSASGCALSSMRPSKNSRPQRERRREGQVWRMLTTRYPDREQATRSAAGSRQPAGARTRSSVGGGSWMTGPATWPPGVEGRTDRLIGPDLGSARWPSRQGSWWWERPPGAGKRMNKGLNNLPLPRAASASKKQGSLPPPPPPSVRRADAPCEAGDRQDSAAPRLTAEDSGNPCEPASNVGFQVKPGPQRRGLRPLRVPISGCQKRAPSR